MLFKRMFLVLAALLIAIPVGTASGAEGFDKSKWYKNIVDYEFVAPFAVAPIRNDVMIIDSRPYARRFEVGHIPMAVSIPDSKFDQMTNLLPKDKNLQLIFYCGGFKCPLSHKSAVKAEALGYTKVAVYAAGMPDWVKNGGIPAVATTHIKSLIDAGEAAVIVDARPLRKAKAGRVPGALMIPDSQFDKYAGLLPAKKDTPLFFYCGGLKCPLSAKSAVKAKALGYTNVALYQVGYPDWVKVTGLVEKVVSPDAKAATVAEKPKAGAAKTYAFIKTSKPGQITAESFKALMKENAGKAMIVDVRDASEVKRDGTFKDAVVIPVGELDKKMATLPKDRPVVFFCSTGGRAGEAYDTVSMLAEGISAFFLDAEVTFKKDGSYTIKPNA